MIDIQTQLGDEAELLLIHTCPWRIAVQTEIGV